MLTKMWRIWAQCKEHRNKFKKFKKNEYISLFSIQDIEKITSHPIQRVDDFYPPDENKERCANFQLESHFQALQNTG